MQITKSNIDAATALLHVNIDVEDYKDQFLSALKKQASKSPVKGFRKGKTPPNLVKKMFGKSILFEVVMEKVNDEVNQYLTNEKMEILGQPMPTDDHPVYSFDPVNLTDMEFIFEIGYIPEYIIKGIDEEYDVYRVQISEKNVDEELENSRKRMGKIVESESEIQEFDRLILRAEELDGDQVKENGWATEFQILVSIISSEELKHQILGKKKGDSFDFNIHDLEKDRDEKYLRKHILKMEDNDETHVGDHFRAVIQSVLRLEPAPLDESFFKNYFKDQNITNEEAAREAIKKDLEAYYEGQCINIFGNHIAKKLKADNHFDLPEAFIKKYLKANLEENKEEKTETDYEQLFSNTRWDLMIKKLAGKFSIEVSEEDLIRSAFSEVTSYFGYNADRELLQQMVKNLIQDKNFTERQQRKISEYKTLEKLYEIVDKKFIDISLEDFNKLVKELNENRNQ
ncbi:MAG TPA: trigger factor [Saprospiraceae bacterium]|nr:trigger factor [Saprospiraceae bacterium]